MPTIRILFVCHGNICRSAAAEMVMRQLIGQRNLTGRIAVSSAAATREEIGHDVYPPMKKALARAGIPCRPHAARLLTREDGLRYDLIIGMDEENLRDMRRILGPGAGSRISLLMDWAGRPGEEIDDPWYTRDFDGCLAQIIRCCEALADHAGSRGP